MSDTNKPWRFLPGGNETTSQGGPMLSAIRAGFDLSTKHTKAFAPTFDCIGRGLDAAVRQPDLDSFFTGDARQIIVAVSDASWTNAAVLTAYNEQDVGHICVAANKALSASLRDCKALGAKIAPMQILSTAWAHWTELADAGIRAGDKFSSILPDIPVGAILMSSSELRAALDAVVMEGGTPVLAIALNSIGSTGQHPKCSVLAIVRTFPTWACASGAVAGHG